MCLMNSFLSKYLDTFLVVFIDDILIYSKMKEEHDEHFQIILQVLRDHKLYDKFRKCEFYKDKIQYLGNVISKEEILVDPDKIEEIIDWHVPKDIMNVRSFMGITGYYRNFIEGFFKNCKSYNIITEKGKEICLE